MQKYWRNYSRKAFRRKRMKTKFIIMLMALFAFTCFSFAGDNEGTDESKLTFDESGYINVDGGKLFYEKVGKGDYFVMVHDGLIHRETYDEQVPFLSKHFTIIRYDRRGYGKSPAATAKYSNVADLKAVFDKFNIKKAYVMGCSAGGGLSIDFTLTYPDLIKGLILIGPVVSGFNYTQHMFNRGGHLTPEIQSDPEKFKKYWALEDPYEMGPNSEEARKRAQELLDANPQNMDFTKGRFIEPINPPAIGRLSEIKVPVLVMAGDHDIPDVIAHIGAICAEVPTARREFIPDAGHLAHMEKPELVNSLILDFLNEVKFIDYIKQNGMEKAVEFYKEGLKKNREATLISERRVNAMGYNALKDGKVEDAIKYFLINVEAFPDSSNVYDSLAEGYRAAGKIDLSIKYYKKSLELNPKNINAKTAIEEMEKY
jgi:3-oxoadipate enol-lactonase